MIVCRQCGERNSMDAQFCRACQAFLEWEGDRAAAPHSGTRPTPESVRLPVTQQPAAQTPAQPPYPHGMPQQPMPPYPYGIPPQQASPPPMPSQPAPTQSAQPTSVQPIQPVQPADPEQRLHYEPMAATDERPLSPGDRICGQCGAGNDSERRFCRRCAASLNETVVVRPPWWRRLIPSRRGRVRRTGERPARRRSGVRIALSGIRRVLLWVVAVLVAMGLLGYGLLPSVRGSINSAAGSVWNRVKPVVAPKYVPVRPVGITATGELPDHPAGVAIDTITTTYWATRDAGPGSTPPALVVTFERPVNLKRAIIRNGAGQDFQNAHRARDLHLVFSTGHTADLTLLDTPDPQTVDIPGEAGANRVEIHVMSRYSAVQGTDLAIAEIEFFEQPS